MCDLLTGKIPFKGDNAVEIAIKQMKDPIPSVCEFNPEIPQSIENIILKATAKNPKNRYDNVMDMYNDLKTALDQERRDEKKIVFQHPEYEIMEDTKKTTRSSKNEERRAEEKEEKKESRINKTLLITGGVVALIGIIIAVVLLVLPSDTSPKEIKIPDVSGMSVERAEAALEEVGFVVKDEVTEKNSDTVDAGDVIETNPKIGRTAKKGATITLIVSKGKNGYIIENYIGENYYTVKATLEANGLVVKLEEEEHTVEDGIEPNVVISQDIEAGTELKDGETITLTIPKIVTIYPDFTVDYTIESVRSFCKTHNITLKETTVETSEYKDGTIISQTIQAGTVVGENDSLQVVVAEAPKVVNYTVKFMNDSTIYKTVEVESGKTISAPAEPTKEGYKFIGWYNGSTLYSFSTKVTDNVTLTAKWEKIVVETPEPPKDDTPEQDGTADTTTSQEDDKVTE